MALSKFIDGFGGSVLNALYSLHELHLAVSIWFFCLFSSALCSPLSLHYLLLLLSSFTNSFCWCTILNYLLYFYFFNYWLGISSLFLWFILFILKQYRILQWQTKSIIKHDSLLELLKTLKLLMSHVLSKQFLVILWNHHDVPIYFKSLQKQHLFSPLINLFYSLRKALVSISNLAWTFLLLLWFISSILWSHSRLSHEEHVHVVVKCLFTTVERHLLQFKHFSVPQFLSQQFF